MSVLAQIISERKEWAESRGRAEVMRARCGRVGFALLVAMVSLAVVVFRGGILEAMSSFLPK